MRASYAVLWCEDGGETIAGKLELGTDGIGFDGGSGARRTTRHVAFRDVATMRVGRKPHDRLESHRTLVFELRDGRTIRVAAAIQPAALAELAERLRGLTGEPDGTPA